MVKLRCMLELTGQIRGIWRMDENDRVPGFSLSDPMAAFDSVASAVAWVQEHAHMDECNRPIVTHEITPWLHRHLACRKFPCVWAMSDPYLWDALCLWCGNDTAKAATLLRHVVLVPGATGKSQQHRLRFLSREQSAQKLGLRAPNCLSNQLRTCITRRVDRKWAHAGPVAVTPDRPVLLLCEYTWLHLTHPQDILGYCVHLLAPDGWYSLREIAAICATTTPQGYAAAESERPPPRIKATADVVAHLEAHLANDELSTLRSMRLVSAGSAYRCIHHLYGDKDVEEHMCAHFECVFGDDTPPSHLRLRQEDFGRVGRRQGGERPVLFALSPGPRLDDECPPFRRLLYALRFVYCSPVYRIRHAAANVGIGRLVLPFGPWAPLLTVRSPKIAYIQRPYNWPLVVGIDRDAALPTVAWHMADGDIDGGAPVCLNPNATAQQIESLYMETLHLPTVFEAVHVEYPMEEVATFVLGGFALHSEQSVRHQCLSLMLLLVMLSPLCTLDEAVSVATLILSALAGDNRTFSVADMMCLTEAHDRAWLRYWTCTDDRSLHREADTGELLQDPRDHAAYQCAQMPVPARPRQPPKVRRRGRSSNDAAQLRRRAAPDDLARMRHAHHRVQQLVTQAALCAKNPKTSWQQKKNKFHRSVCNTEEAIKYRTARRHQVGS